MNSNLSEKISKFLSDQIIWYPYQLSMNDKEYISKQGLSEFIFARITSTKFRRTGLDDVTNSDIRFKIRHQVLQNNPISFSIPFGAYKNWHLWSYPEPDWAEVFNLAYMIRFLAPISAVYEPGAQLNYTFSDDVMDIVSNIPKNDYKRYIKVFLGLLSKFQETLPDNVVLRLVRINDLYKDNDQLLEMQINFKDNQNNWSTKYTEEERSKKIASARYNLKLNGVIDLTNLNADQLEEKFLQSAMWCDALDSLNLRRKFNKGTANIQIVFVKGPYLGLHLGSCETSIGQAWVKTGLVEIRDSGYFPTMLSHSQFTLLKQEVEFLNVDTLFRDLSQNFSVIPVRILK
ncbi:MAG: hypothetical protein H3C64_15285 [Candidatus Kuenenia stuttgartiensis]|nr:hypothetical protein [Candidatus Kuenenia stuttgartiensis]